ncbi:MAG TPA: hypothetical protein VFF16_09055 [Telluria sp.]|nr:hypothetical protein [Telluria sp.]
MIGKDKVGVRWACTRVPIVIAFGMTVAAAAAGSRRRHRSS